MKLNNFGQVPLVMVGTAVASAAVNVHDARQVGKIQKYQEKKLSSDEQAMTYVRNILNRFESLGIRLAKTSGTRPGTPEFEALLNKAMASDMAYQGNCNVDIYVPPTADSKPGARDIWGSINRSGFLTQPSQLPPDVGPMWSTGCKNAQDQFRIAHIESIKSNRQFRRVKTIKSDTGVVNLFITFGASLFLMIVFLLSIKMQSAVIKAQRRKPRPKPKRKKC